VNGEYPPLTTVAVAVALQLPAQVGLVELTEIESGVVPVTVVVAVAVQLPAETVTE
jgi:hypothetical protein